MHDTWTYFRYSGKADTGYVEPREVIEGDERSPSRGAAAPAMPAAADGGSTGPRSR